MPADIFVYALITAGLIFWLRSILGTRHGEERDRSVPYLKPVPSDEAADTQNPAKGQNAEVLITDLAENPRDGMSIAGKAAQDGLLAVAGLDRAFEVGKFLRAAQDAFVFIVESFADGDRATLKDLLSPEVFAAFDGAITAREKAGEKMQTEILSIKKSEIAEAKLVGRNAFITVRFFAEEINVTRDANGEVVAGHPEKVTQMRDLWTFSRDLKSRDPRWLVVSTREDGEGDSETIPNTQ